MPPVGIEHPPSHPAVYMKPFVLLSYASLVVEYKSHGRSSTKLPAQQSILLAGSLEVTAVFLVPYLTQDSMNLRKTSLVASHMTSTVQDLRGGPQHQQLQFLAGGHGTTDQSILFQYVFVPIQVRLVLNK
ncbi:hypothetical protein CEXT_349081 [Caerostris extrusa]|uniref:Uncharacterized protein n=1 Tax=Caerostris extrusa TaxID=172846 RepID=A0AAV4U987_CAEEX|nr:hypothetical protein CEXT_349081 [Caerostris extrusa]